MTPQKPPNFDGRCPTTLLTPIIGTKNEYMLRLNPFKEQALRGGLLTEKALFINQSVINSILSYAKACHPNEGILLLRGKIWKDKIVIDEVEIPPLTIHGQGFSNFPLHMLPIDFSVVGTAHSHPSGVLHPSTGDLNNFYGNIMVITAFPYETNQDILVLNSEGKPVKYETVQDLREI